MSTTIDAQTAAESPSADELVERFRRGDERAFDELVLRFQRRIFNLALRMVNDYEEASDLAQEIFVRVYRNLHRFRGESSFSTWLYAVAANMCRNRRRRLVRIARHETESLDEARPGSAGGEPRGVAAPGDNPETEVERREMGQWVARYVAELPPDFAVVMVLRDVQGMAYDEIAAALDCSVGTVKSRLARARLRVRQKLVRLYGRDMK